MLYSCCSHMETVGVKRLSDRCRRPITNRQQCMTTGAATMSCRHRSLPTTQHFHPPRLNCVPLSSDARARLKGQRRRQAASPASSAEAESVSFPNTQIVKCGNLGRCRVSYRRESISLCLHRQVHYWSSGKVSDFYDREVAGLNLMAAVYQHQLSVQRSRVSQ